MRYAIEIEYIGEKFHGWQIQNDCITVQKIIQKALFFLTQEKIVIYGSGRTDKDVNAIQQIAHFDLSKYMKTKNIVLGLNFYIRSLSYQNDIRILNAYHVKYDFHARFSCKNRTYMYQLTSEKSIYFSNCLYIKKQQKENLYKNQYMFLGTHDFKLMRSKFCSSKKTIRTIESIKIKEERNIIKIFIKSKAFLHHQVRYMIGNMIYEINKPAKARYLYLYRLEY